MQEQYNKDNEIEIDLRELFFELLAHWRMIALSTVLMGAIGFAITAFFMTPQYESTSELHVLSKSTSTTSLTDLQTGTNLMNDYLVVVKGRPVLEQVIKNLDLAENYKQLQGKLTLHNPSNSRILQITVQDADPNRAKIIADEIAEVASDFITVKMEQASPSILSYGYADGGVVSPSIKKNTVIGAFLGAVLACAIVLAAFLLNDTIMSAEDIERKLGLYLLGTIPLEEDEGTAYTERKLKKKHAQQTA